MKDIYESLKFTEQETEYLRLDGKTWHRDTTIEIGLDRVDELFPSGDGTLVSQLVDELKALWKYAAYLKENLQTYPDPEEEPLSYEQFKGYKYE